MLPNAAWLPSVGNADAVNLFSLPSVGNAGAVNGALSLRTALLPITGHANDLSGALLPYLALPLDAGHADEVSGVPNRGTCGTGSLRVPASASCSRQ